MKFIYSPERDALFIKLCEDDRTVFHASSSINELKYNELSFDSSKFGMWTERTSSVDIRFDHDKDGRVIAIEILGASKTYDMDDLMRCYGKSDEIF